MEATIRDRAVLAFALVSIVSTLIVVPRPTNPQLVPLPRFDMLAAQRLDDVERQRARAVMGGALPNSVRSIGEQLRRVGFKLAVGHGVSARRLERLELDALSLAMANRHEEMLQLRALQSELFVDAVHRYEQSGEISRDLRELGGNFVAFLERGWSQSEVGVVFSDAELRLLYRNHFNKLTGLTHHRPFAPELEERRWYYATLFEHPPVAPSDADAKDEARLRYAAALGKADQAYDARLAQGLLHLRLGRPAQAARLLSEHLRNRRSDDWNRVAENALGLCEILAKKTVNGSP